MGGEWRPDPSGRHHERFHDGAGWTDRVRDRGIENTDRLGRPAAAAPASEGDGWTSASWGSEPVGRRADAAPPAPMAAPPTAPPPGPPAAPAPVGSAARDRRSGVPWTAIAVAGSALLVVAAVVGTVLVIVEDRAPTRSVEAFCSTLESEQERIIGEFESSTGAAQASGDDFAALFLTVGASMQALGELQTSFAKLAEVAPEEIQTEAELVADKIGDALEVPDLSMEGIAGSMLTSMQLSGPLNTLNGFAEEHCGQSI